MSDAALDDESRVVGETPDGQGDTDGWTETDSRIWAAHQAMDQDALLAYVLPAEVDVIITNHLMLLDDLGGIDVPTSNVTETGLRLYAEERIHAFVQAGITEFHVNILSRLIIGEDLFPTDDDESLRIADLDFDHHDAAGD